MASENRLDMSNTCSHLVLVEYVIGNMNNLLYLDDAANALYVHISQHGKYQNPLHQQLSILRLRDAVKNPFHMHRKLDLSWGHLKREEKIELQKGIQCKEEKWRIQRI